MSSQFTGWRFLVNFLLPPPLLLTFLLVLPFPRNIRKGLLLFTSRVMTFAVAGGMKLVHLALILSGIPLFDSGVRTYRQGLAVADSELTPNQKIGLLAKKWREERNFWIAAMAFTLWCLLTVLYAQVDRSLALEDRLDEVQAALDDATGVVRDKAPPKPKAKLPGFSFGLRKGAVKEASPAAAPDGTQEVEMSAGDDSAGGRTAVRKRAGAAAAAAQGASI